MIYILDIEYLLNENNYLELYNKMPDFRKDKADKFRFMKDKACSVGAWGLLLYGLKDYGINNDTDVSFTEYGKPFFTNYPQVEFNISHSETKVICAISDKPIGCDIQVINKEDNSLMSLAKRFFSNRDYQYLESLPEGNRIDEFYRIWTIKESYIKALGTGLSKELNSFDVIFDDKKISVGDDSYFCHEIEGYDEYKIAYCSSYETEEKIEVLDRI